MKESNEILNDFYVNNNAQLILRLDGTIFDANDSFCRLFSINESQVYDLQFKDIIY